MFALSPDLRQLADALRPALALGEGAVPDRKAADLAFDRHRVAPLLHRALELAGAEVEPALAERLAKVYQRNVQHLLRRKAAALQLQRLFEPAAIRAVEIKGSQLGEQLYGEAGLRHAKDVDLLVEPGRMGEALKLVAAEGYRSRSGKPIALWRAGAILRFHRETAIFDPKNSIQIELHSRLLASPPPGWDEATFFGQPLDLASPDYVLYLVLHGAGSRWNRLKWLCDLAMIARKVTQEVQDAVLDKAREYDCLPTLAASFSALAEVWEDPAFAQWSDAIGLTPDDPRTARFLAEFGEALNREGSLASGTLLARRLELERDAPLFGTRPQPRFRAMVARSALWFLRRGE